MSKFDKFKEDILQSYEFEGESIILGGAMLDKECITNHHIKLPLSTLNRHGLISGATGTGKTKTLQILAERLSEKGVPSLVMDVKGDLSGIAQPSQGHPKIDERHDLIGSLPFTPGSSPVEFLTLSDEKGARLRATVSEFGPILLSKILQLNDVQQGIIAIVFKYCDDRGIPLLDLDDLKKTLQWFIGEGKEEVRAEYGTVSSRSVGTIMRKIIELEQQDAERFFGERSFDVRDLTLLDSTGAGIVNIIRLTDIQDKPNLFSTFMLQLLAEIYTMFPEEGDVEKPKLVLFIDEAHLIFNKASSALLDQIETIVKLIRSKGVGIIFVTQNPIDIPDIVLSQLGLKIQHALRAFTAKDRKSIKMAAENFPISDYYNVDQLLTELGIGEALVTVLNEDGIPTTLAHTLLRAPMSRMDVLSEAEINYIVRSSYLVQKYNEEINRQSAYEILNEKIAIAQEEEQLEEIRQQREKESRSRQTRSRSKKSGLEKAIDSSMSQLGRSLARELARGLIGVMKGRR